MKVKRKPRIFPVAPSASEPSAPEAPSTELAPVKARTYRLAVSRRQAGIDYITDPESRSVEFHYKREDRHYPKIIAYRQFQGWSIEDRWVARRDQFWHEVEQRVLTQWRDKLVSQRMHEIEELTEIRSYMTEYLVPLKDRKTGEVERDELGLPRYGLPLPNFGSFVKMWLEVDSKLMAKRGETTGAVQAELPKDGTAGPSALDPVSTFANFSREDLQAIARVLLRRRQPELADDLVLDESGEEEKDADPK